MLNKFIRILSIFVIISNALGYTITAWEPIFKGVDMASGEGYSPDGRPQKVKAIRVDLYNEDVELFTTPGNGDEPLETTRRTGSTFVNTYGVQVAINANYCVRQLTANYANLDGLSISRGQIVSPPENLNAALGVNPGTLLVNRENEARIEVTSPSTDLTDVWTAVESWAYLLVNGANHGDYRIIPGNVEPRSTLGLCEQNRYLFLMTIDGRQPGYSEGATSFEQAEWLIRFGAYNGVNLDGGGSTHLWVSEYGGNKYPINSPTENRAVPNHLGIYAAPLDQNIEIRDDTFIYASFENAIEGYFNLTPGYSGSTIGIDRNNSSAMADSSQSFKGDLSQRLIITDDPAAGNGWLVRHLSGSGTRANNKVRLTQGYVGFWAKTINDGCEITIALDNTNNTTADRGNWKSLISDGQWHLYEWNLEDNNDWHGWVSGNGLIDTADFTIDSIQIRRLTAGDAIIYIDEIAHSARKSLKYLFAILGDFQPDGIVDLKDYAAFAGNWMSDAINPDFNALYDINYPYNNLIDLQDLKVLASNWLKSED